jgi:hypothetical protein
VQTVLLLKLLLSSDSAGNTQKCKSNQEPKRKNNNYANQTKNLREKNNNYVLVVMYWTASPSLTPDSILKKCIIYYNQFFLSLNKKMDLVHQVASLGPLNG